MTMFSMRRMIPAALCLVLAAPAAMYAQAAAPASAAKQLTPSESMGALLHLMEQEVMSAADAMPAEKYDFAPPATAGDFKGVRTFGSQVKHIAESNYEFFQGWGPAPAMDPKSIEALKTKADIMKALKDSYTYVETVVNSITPENAFVSVGGPPNFKMTRISATTFCLAHSMDHYGQLVEYLRMNSIIPPASRPGASQ